MGNFFNDFDLSAFWQESNYATTNYVSEPANAESIQAIEAELGYKLPLSYIELMNVQNGGIPVNTSAPVNEETSWADDHVEISGIFGIGRDKKYSLLGSLGSQFMIDEWGYPEIGVYICNCPSAGHDMVALDYSKNGKEGEPEVVHVDQEGEYKITLLAENFESFIKGLRHFSDFV